MAEPERVDGRSKPDAVESHQVGRCGRRAGCDDLVRARPAYATREPRRCDEDPWETRSAAEHRGVTIRDGRRLTDDEGGAAQMIAELLVGWDAATASRAPVELRPIAGPLRGHARRVGASTPPSTRRRSVARPSPRAAIVLVSVDHKPTCPAAGRRPAALASRARRPTAWSVHDRGPSRYSSDPHASRSRRRRCESCTLRHRHAATVLRGHVVVQPHCASASTIGEREASHSRPAIPATRRRAVQLPGPVASRPGPDLRSGAWTPRSSCSTTRRPMVRRITLNRPEKRNALNATLRREILTATPRGRPRRPTCASRHPRRGHVLLRGLRPVGRPERAGRAARLQRRR